MKAAKVRVASKVAAAVSDLTSQLGALREKIAKLQAERESVEAAPVPKAEALAALDAKLEGLAGEFERRAANIADKLTRAGSGAEGLEIVELILEGGGLLEHDVNPALAWFFGPQIRARLTEALEVTYRGIKPIAVADRAAELAKIDAALLEAGIAEEALIEEAEEAGLQLGRREDADPVIVLGLVEGAA